MLKYRFPDDDFIINNSGHKFSVQKQNFRHTQYQCDYCKLYAMSCDINIGKFHTHKKLALLTCNEYFIKNIL